MRIPRFGVIAAIARMLQVTEGQASTLVIGLAVGLGGAIVAVPAALEDQPGRPQAFAQPLPADEPSNPPEPEAEPTAARDGAAQEPSRPTRDGPTGPRSAPLSLPTFSTGEPGSSGRTGEQPPPTPAPPPDDPSTGAPVGSVAEYLAVAGRPAGVAVADDGRTFLAVTDSTGGEATVIVLAADGRVEAEHPVEVDPEGPGLLGLSLHGDTVVVARAAPPSVLWMDVDTGEVVRTSDIPDVSACVVPLLGGTCEPGPIDHPPQPTGVAAAGDGTLYVTDATQATVWRLPPDGGRVDAWLQREEFISEAGPIGLGIDLDGNLVVSVSESAVAATGGAIYRVPVTAGGAAGEPELVATTDPGTEPAELALARSGRIYVALRGTGELLVLRPDGTEADRYLDQDDTPALDRPFGVSFVDQAVLVTGVDPDARGRVLRVEVGERGVHAGPEG